MMKALVYYCRWQGVSLRLRGRDGTAVWGELVTVDPSGNETVQPFNFELATAILRLPLDAGERILALDEMGVPRAQDPDSD